MPSLLLIINTILVIIAIIIWLNGYKAIRLFLIVSGGFCGYIAAAYINRLLMFNDLKLLILTVAAVAIGAALFNFAYHAAFVLGGGFIGVYFVFRYSQMLGQASTVERYLIGAAVGIILGVLLRKSFIIFGTAWVGSVGIVFYALKLLRLSNINIGAYLPQIITENFTIFLLLLPLPLTLIGAKVQYNSLRGKHND